MSNKWAEKHFFSFISEKTKTKNKSLKNQRTEDLQQRLKTTTNNNVLID